MQRIAFANDNLESDGLATKELKESLHNAFLFLSFVLNFRIRIQKNVCEDGLNKKDWMIGWKKTVKQSFEKMSHVKKFHVYQAFLTSVKGVSENQTMQRIYMLSV